MFIQLLVRLEGEQSDFASAPNFYCRHYSGWKQAMALDVRNSFRVLNTKGTEYVKNNRSMSTLHRITFTFSTKRRNSLKIRGKEHGLLLSSVQPYSLPLRDGS